MSIEKNEKQDLNQEAFKKEFWKLEWDSKVLDKLGGNFEWDLKQTGGKAFDELTQWKFGAMDPKKQEELDAINKSILEEAWNDPKKMISMLTEAKNIIETAEWSAANKNQADLDKSKTDAQKSNKDGLNWKESLSKMRNDIIDLVKQNQDNAKLANNSWTEEQKKSWAEAEKTLAEWPESTNEKKL